MSSRLHYHEAEGWWDEYDPTAEKDYARAWARRPAAAPPERPWTAAMLDYWSAFGDDVLRRHFAPARVAVIVAHRERPSA